jgi:hypothetical protein
MKQLKITITAKTKPNLLIRLNKIQQHLKRGCFAGFGSSNDGQHHYQITEVNKHE